MIRLNVGDLLIAPPHMTDARFSKSVLLLTHHTEGGSFAVCLNRLTNYTILDISKELELDKELNFPLFWGGPVQQSSIWMLHSPDWANQHTMEINSDWCLTSDQGMFHSIADGDTPHYFRFLHGFCSWAPRQLEKEIEGKPPWSSNSSWLVANNPGIGSMFECPEENLWEYTTDVCQMQAVDSWI